MEPEHAFAAIKVSSHARRRARQRFDVGVSRVKRDVRYALLFDRVAEETPSWFAVEPRSELGRRCSLVWSRDRERLYIVSGSSRAVHVITAIKRCRGAR